MDNINIASQVSTLFLGLNQELMGSVVTNENLWI
jgi:hypothetical protein